MVFEIALRSLMIQPGTSNGEDITFDVIVTAANAEGQILVDQSSTRIPVDPVIQGGLSVVGVPSETVTGNEDTVFRLASGLQVDFFGLEDIDGSETEGAGDSCRELSFADYCTFWVR